MNEFDAVRRRVKEEARNRSTWLLKLIGLVAVSLFLLVGACSSVQTVAPGHVAVGSLFGKVDGKAIDEGFHIVNLLKDWTDFDCRQKRYDFDGVPMPSADQLITSINFSVQYRANCSMAPEMLKETGNMDAVVETHLVPYFRSVTREQGKGIAVAEDYFQEAVQTRLQAEIRNQLSDAMVEKGLIVSEVLVGKVTLPPVIAEAVQAKKERQQKAEQEAAELERFAIEQDKLVKTAESKKQAAELEAAQILLLAKAQADANRELARSLTRELIEYEALQVEREAVGKWVGTLPQVTSGATPFIDLRERQ